MLSRGSEVVVVVVHWINFEYTLYNDVDIDAQYVCKIVSMESCIYIYVEKLIHFETNILQFDNCYLQKVQSVLVEENDTLCNKYFIV